MTSIPTRLSLGSIFAHRVKQRSDDFGGGGRMRWSNRAIGLGRRSASFGLSPKANAAAVATQPGRSFIIFRPTRSAPQEGSHLLRDELLSAGLRSFQRFAWTVGGHMPLTRELCYS